MKWLNQTQMVYEICRMNAVFDLIRISIPNRPPKEYVYLVVYTYCLIETNWFVSTRGGRRISCNRAHCQGYVIFGQNVEYNEQKIIIGWDTIKQEA